MNTEPSLFPFSCESSPANTGGTICPRYQVGRNCAWCCFRALVCSDLLTAESVRVMLLWKQQRGALQSSTALRLAAPHQVAIERSGRIHIFSSAYTRENGNDVLFFALLLALICFNSSTLFSSLTGSSFLVDKTFLSRSSQFSILIAQLKMLQVSAWITRRQKTSQISWLFTVGLIPSPLASKIH